MNRLASMLDDSVLTITTLETTPPERKIRSKFLQSRLKCARVIWNGLITDYPWASINNYRILSISHNYRDHNIEEVIYFLAASKLFTNQSTLSFIACLILVNLNSGKYRISFWLLAVFLN